jgi:tryptophan 2,3-dioxygenase
LNLPWASKIFDPDGTDGTGGVSYLRKRLDAMLLPKIWTLRTQLQG